MVDVDSMSDAELRVKLHEFGFPVMPITGSTRKVMAKKLRVLLENRERGDASRRSLGKYSSEDDESGEEAAARAARGAPRRATAGGGAPAGRKPATAAAVAPSVRKAEERPVVVEERKVTTRTSRVAKSVSEGFDTGSDTESEVVETTTTTRKSAVNNHQEYQSNLPFVKPNPPSSSSSSYVYHSPRASDAASPSPRGPVVGMSASDYAAERLNQIRSRLSLNTSYGGGSGSGLGSYSGLSRDSSDDVPVEAPFLSSFSRRLSSLSPPTRRHDLVDKPEIEVNNDATNGASASPSYVPKYTAARPVKREFIRDYRRTDTKGGSNLKNNAVSCAVVALALAFFVGLAFMYVGMRDAQTEIDGFAADLNIPRCDLLNRGHRRGRNCVADPDFRETVEFFRALVPRLADVAVASRCSPDSPPPKPYLTEADVSKLAARFLPDYHDEKLLLGNVEIVTVSNPRLDVFVVAIDKESDKDFDKNLIESLEDLEEVRSEEDGRRKLGLVFLNPQVPWKCVLYDKLSVLIQFLIAIGGLALAVYSTNFLYKYLKHYQQKRDDELYYMVERIVDTLQGNATEDGENYLVINHVRDMIIPINDRSRMEKVWRKAVKFINENESRVRTEMQVVQGEPYEVWRWLGNPNLNASGGVRNKSWQGQAFETGAGAANSPPCSPTPCLKVRGMVDDGDRNLSRTIREAVLAKCGAATQPCRVLHCAVDPRSRCVYLRCADQADAAVAYRSLHGWWYAGNLVTVKYLRLERYMQRYPDSPSTGPPYLKALQQPGADWIS